MSNNINEQVQSQALETATEMPPNKKTARVAAAEATKERSKLRLDEGYVVDCHLLLVRPDEVTSEVATAKLDTLLAHITGRLAAAREFAEKHLPASDELFTSSLLKTAEVIVRKVQCDILDPTGEMRDRYFLAERETK